MQDQEIAVWGKSLLEEILLQAGLASTDSATPLDRIVFNMPFQITADPLNARLAVSYTRIGGESMALRIEIPKAEKNRD